MFIEYSLSIGYCTVSTQTGHVVEVKNFIWLVREGFWLSLVRLRLKVGMKIKEAVSY